MLSHDTKCNTIDVIYMEQDKLSLQVQHFNKQVVNFICKNFCLFLF